MWWSDLGVSSSVLAAGSSQSTSVRVCVCVRLYSKCCTCTFEYAGAGAHAASLRVHCAGLSGMVLSVCGSCAPRGACVICSSSCWPSTPVGLHVSMLGALAVFCLGFTSNAVLSMFSATRACADGVCCGVAGQHMFTALGTVCQYCDIACAGPFAGRFATFNLSGVNMQPIRTAPH